MGFKASEQLFGVHELYRPLDGEAEIDIVAVHGLGGHATKSWSDGNNMCWLDDPSMLPKYVKRARVLAYGYNANVSSWANKKTSTDRILQHALTLVQHLQSDRMIEDAERRPVIFICHSLGGIIVKRALAYSSTCTSPGLAHLHSIYTSAFAVLFFGTPHHGSSKASLLSYLQTVASLTVPSKLLRSESSLVNALKEESEILQDINDQFAPLMRRFRIYFFWETERMNLKYTKDYIVKQNSAAPMMDNTERCGLVGDHRQMCKFAAETDQGFRTVVSALRRYSVLAPAVVAERWMASDAAMKEIRRQEALELVRTGDASQVTTW